MKQIRKEWTRVCTTDLHYLFGERYCVSREKRNYCFQQSHYSTIKPSDGWLKAVSSERLKRDIDMLQKIVPSSKQFFVAHINYQKSSLILCICSKNRRLCVLMLCVLKGISRTLPNIYNVVFAKIVNGLQLLTICEKKLHYRCLTGF